MVWFYFWNMHVYGMHAVIPCLRHTIRSPRAPAAGRASGKCARVYGGHRRGSPALRCLSTTKREPRLCSGARARSHAPLALYRHHIYCRIDAEAAQAGGATDASPRGLRCAHARSNRTNAPPARPQRFAARTRSSPGQRPARGGAAPRIVHLAPLRHAFITHSTARVAPITPPS